ncbi:MULTISPECIES: hypothetical protein [unclassified Vibrio]|uniref:hypothetical protein n=1 Tax=unclassified Vibrio TaxID=2614977 RepID=UPI0010559933|nr:MULTISPECIES: hypothetical protein [unclassified Vibrio]
MPLPKGTNKTFIRKAIKQWGDRYDYSLVQYVNSRSSIIIICKKHKKKFEQTPKAHFSAKRHCCPFCYQEVAGSYQNKWRAHYKPDSNQANLNWHLPIIKSVFRDF